MIKDDEYIVKVEKISSDGQGISRIDGEIIFVDGTCPGDLVKIRIVKNNKSYATAKIVEIISPSPHRVVPFCPMFNACGACHLQFVDYNYQLELKKQIVEDTIKNITGCNIPIKDTIPSPIIKEYRRKIQYPISSTKDSKRILAGYYKPKTHDIVNIKYCPIQPKICDDIIDFIRLKAYELGLTGYNEKKHNGDIRHVVIRNSSVDNSNLVVLVVNSNKSFFKIDKLANLIYDNFDKVVGVCVNFNSKKTNVILGNKTEILYGKNFVTEKLLNKNFKIGVSTFFQINPISANNIFQFVKNYISENYNAPIVLDAYSGIATFGICVQDVCKKVVCVEENSESTKLAQELIKDNKINNIEVINKDATEYLQNTSQLFDIIIIDPPRKGCTIQAIDGVSRIVKDTIIYVSCNPATLARDLKIFIEKGFKVEYIQPVDMFCHTYHIENIAIIKK